MNAAKAFLRKAMTAQRIPNRTGPPARQTKAAPMLGLKSFRTAAVVISGIELAEKIKKKQFQISKLGALTARMAEIWQAALAA